MCVFLTVFPLCTTSLKLSVTSKRLSDFPYSSLVSIIHASFKYMQMRFHPSLVPMATSVFRGNRGKRPSSVQAQHRHRFLIILEIFYFLSLFYSFCFNKIIFITFLGKQFFFFFLLC